MKIQEVLTYIGKVQEYNLYSCLQIFHTDLEQIKLPQKMRKHGRPKGSEKTIIGLPRKKKCGNKTLLFLKKLPIDRDKGLV